MYRMIFQLYLFIVQITWLLKGTLHDPNVLIPVESKITKYFVFEVSSDWELTPGEVTARLLHAAACSCVATADQAGGLHKRIGGSMLEQQ